MNLERVLNKALLERLLETQANQIIRPIVFPKELKLIRKGYESVQTNTFDITRLKTLQDIYLDDNLIYKIESDAFHGQDNLEKLNLKMNKTRNVDRNVFQGLIKLNYLILNESEIQKIHMSSFNKNLISLTSLDLSYNHLVIIHGDLFKNFTRMKIE